MAHGSNDYKVSSIYLAEADFKVLIIHIPEDEVEDKLTYLAREKGHITKSLYDDFLIATCVANINQLVFHVSQHSMMTTSNLLDIRTKLVNIILEYNPKFDPNNLIINSNYVVKVKSTTTLSDGDKKLTDNVSWNTSYYDEITNLYNQSIPPEEDVQGQPPPPKGSKTVIPPKKGTSGIKDINELPFTVKQKWWARLRQYVSIKCFNPEDSEAILNKSFFHNRASFGTYVVSICVENFEELFQLLDTTGVTVRVSAQILINELYQLCFESNEFLTYQNALNYTNDNEEDEPVDTSDEEGNKRTFSNHVANNNYLNKKKKPGRKFKDISKQELLKLGDKMKLFLIGQGEAVDTMTEAIQRASIGLKDPNRPIGSFLFAGRTGVGKTLATKVLADELIKSRNNMVTIDCSEYSADHEYSKLIGAPSGYVGYEAGGVLTNAVMKNPFTVVVFDEVEKASSKVHQLLLQILEEGRLTDGKGKAVSFKDTVVIMTSNVGVKEIDSIGKTIGFGDASTITDSKKDKELTKALKNKFKPEFLNRIDAIINFKTLTKQDYMRIIDLELYKLNDNLKSNDTEYKNLELKFDDNIKKFVYTNGINEEYGARPLKRCIEEHIATPLAKKLLQLENLELDSVVSITATKGKPKFSIEKRKADLPFYMTEQYNAEAVANSATQGMSA